MNKIERLELAIKLFFEGKYNDMSTFADVITEIYCLESNEGIDLNELHKFERLCEITSRYDTSDVRLRGKRIYFNDKDVLSELEKFSYLKPEKD
ncbi:MAG: hypothetical protein LUD81_06680 [Clostridiales bacterium]|nr:hypothetical protein [Clostridiales bacterium]